MTQTTREVPLETPTGSAAIKDHRFWWAIGVITLAQLALRGWAAAGGWFYWDDFWWHDIVARNGLWETAGMSLGGHYSPLTYVPYYLVTAAFPYEWAPRVVIMLITLLAINAGVLAVSGRLWPTRGPQLAVYVLWAFSSLAAPSWLWYSQFSMMGALLLVSTLCMWAYLRALQMRTTRSAALAVAVLVVALFTQERMLVVAVLVGAWLIFVVGSNPRRVLGAYRGLWLGSAAVLLAYFMVYRYVVVDAPGSLLPTGGDALTLGLRMLTISAAPALLGGPVALDGTPVLGRAGHSPVISIVALVVICLAVLLSQRLNSRAWRAWAVLVAGLVLDAGLVVMARGATLGEAAEGEWRYFSDLAVLAPVLVVSAFVPAGTKPVFSRSRARLLAVSIAVVAGAGAFTTVALGMLWHDSASRPFFERARSSLLYNAGRSIMDGRVPEAVVNPALGVQGMASRVFSLAGVEAVFDEPTANPLWVSEDGSLVDGDLVVRRQSTLSGLCPYPLQGTTSAVIALEGDWDFDWGVRIEYTVETAQSLVVRLGQHVVQTQVRAGRGRIFVPSPGPFLNVTVFSADPSARGCITGVVAGPASAAGSSSLGSDLSGPSDFKGESGLGGGPR